MIEKKTVLYNFSKYRTKYIRKKFGKKRNILHYLG